MAIEKTIVIKADADQANKSIETVDKNMQQLDKTTDDVNSNVTKSTKLFRGLGTAIKATGIGLLVALVAKLGQTFTQNSKVVGFFNTAMIALNKAFNDLFEFIFNNFGKWTQFIKDAFENPQQSIKNFAEAIKENLEERFNSLIEVLGFVGDAFKKLFQGDFKGALDSVKEAGKEYVDVITGVDGSVEKITMAVEEGSKAIAEYAKETVNAAEQINNLRSSFAQIENQQTRLREAADRDAEAQRRLRDDFTQNIDARIEANNKLADVIDRQEKAEKATVQARINALNTEQKLLGFRQERANEIFALQTELIAIEAQQSTFRSEQEQNAIALQKERIELGQSEIDAQNQRRLDQLEFEAEQEELEANKIIKLQERLALENELLEEDLKRKKQLFAEGTQARVDAEQEYFTAKQDLEQKEKELEQQSADEEESREKAVANAKIGIAKNTLSLIQELAGEGSKVGKALAVGQATISAVEGTVNAFKSAQDSPITTVFPAYPFVQAGLAGAFGFAQVAKIKSTDETGASSSGSGGGQSAPPVSAPSFNLVEGTGTDQIADTIQNQDRPIKAFVVSNDVTSQQELDRNAVESATL